MTLKSNPANLFKALQEAIALQNHGWLDEADSIYRDVLRQVPGHPDALHLRALVCHAKERFAEAVLLAEAAINSAPRVANFYNTAGEAHRRLGQLDKARQCLTEAVRLDPAMIMAHHNLALVCSAESNFIEARRFNQQALALNPEYVDAIAHGVDVACELDDEPLASNLARRLEKYANHKSAKTSMARYHVYRARRFLNQGKIAEADQAAQAAIAASPEFWGGWALRGEAHFEQADLANAELYCTIAANLAPDNADARVNLALILQHRKRFDDSTSHLTDWLAVHPDDAAARFGLAGTALIQGDYATGWTNFEARWQLPSHKSSKFTGAPQWDGRTVNRLLLTAEQGLGDSVQMLRFVPEVIRRCTDSVVLQLPEPLVRLARRIFGPAGVTVTLELPAESFDATCSLMSLPLVLEANSKERLLSQSPYLSASPERTAEFSALLARQPGKKLGIIWRGSAGSSTHRLRTLPESELLSLLDVPGWTPVSLQFGIKAPQIASRPLYDLSDEIADFDDLAAAMMAVDAVVSLDTGPAHLAGALGVHTYTLLPWYHEWRWGVEGDRCDWYAGMELFRQPLDGAWRVPISQVAEKLGGMPLPAESAAANVHSDQAIRGNRFPFVRAACRYGTFTLPLFDRYVTRSMLAYGEYSPRQAEVLCSYLRPGATAIDVGANLGALTLAMAQAVGPTGRIVAFEPQSMAHQCLTATLAENGIQWVEARRQAVGAMSGIARIGDPARGENFGGIGLAEGSEGGDAELVCLDDLDLGNCRLIKIDIEGLELEVLQGSSRLIAACRPVLYVKSDHPDKTASLVEFLKGYGYRLYRHEPPLFAPQNYRECTVDLFPGRVSGNLLALPPGDQPPSDAIEI